MDLLLVDYNGGDCDDGDDVYGDGDRVFTNLNSGQIYPSAFPEMLRVVRPGGYILIAMKVCKWHQYLQVQYIWYHIDDDVDQHDLGQDNDDVDDDDDVDQHHLVQDGYNSQSTRFAMMDSDIQDLVWIVIKIIILIDVFF